MGIALNSKSLLNQPLILKKLDLDDRQKIADLGSGKFGYFIFPLAKAVGKNGFVYAIDILKDNLDEISKRARLENLNQVKTVWSNLEIFKATNIESSSLDAALLVNTLNQSDKKAEIIREGVRMLKRSGKLLIIEWKNIDSPFGPAEERRVKIEAIKHNAHNLGLQIIDEFDAGLYHYGLLLKKL